MSELELLIAAIAIVLFLIIILIVFMVQKRISKKENLKKDQKFTKPNLQAEENKLTIKVKLETASKREHLPEPQVKEPLRSSTKTNRELIIESQTHEMGTLTQTDSYESLPQDSMLRRHYLTHLRTMIESLNPPHPTDSTLSRHYDSIISAQMEQCLSDQGAIERLICNYENHKKTIIQQIQEPKTIAEPLLKAETTREDSLAQKENPKLPEDSMLRRHFITNLYAIVESNLPPRPTDSVLRRHYDTMVNTEVNKLLGCKVV